MRLRITIAMLEIRNRETLQSKVNICKSDVKIGDYADSLALILLIVVITNLDRDVSLCQLLACLKQDITLLTSL